jgi:hypothetical protein
MRQEVICIVLPTQIDFRYWHRADHSGCPLIGRYRVISGPIERQTRLAEFMSLRPKLEGI